MRFFKSRGTNASPSNVSANDLVGAFTFNPYIGSSYTNDRALFGANMATNTGVGIFFIAGSTNLNYNPSIYIHPTSNVSIGSTQSIITGITDAGFRLDVNGTARVSGELIVNGVNIGLGGGAISTNTRVGAGALNGNTTGDFSTAIGRDAMNQQTTGRANTAIGNDALRHNVLGSDNVAVGRQSARFIADGTTSLTNVSNGVFIGQNTRALSNNSNNEIVIGNTAIGLGSNTTVLGNTSTTATAIYGRLLLGTTSDNGTDRIQAVGNIRVSGIIQSVNSVQNGLILSTNDLAGNTGNIGVYLSSPFSGGTINDAFFRVKRGAGSVYNGAEIAVTNQFRILTSTTEDTNEALRVTSNRNLLIGTTTDAGFRLDVNGTARIQGNTIITGSLTVVTGSAVELQVTPTGVNIGSVITDTHNITGSVTITGSLAVNNSNVILSNQTSSMSVATASFATNTINATTASYVLNAVSASHATFAVNAGSATTSQTSSFSTNFTVANTLILDQTLTDYATVASSIAGSNNLFTQATGSYTSVFIKYTATNGSNTRAGEVIAAWNGANTTFTDFSTVDLGTTNAVTASVSIVTAQVQFNIQTNTSGWRLKAMATFI
jgi:hypothetical protein